MLELHDRVAVPEPLTVLGVTGTQDKPEEGFADIVTVPEKPFADETVIVDEEDAPGATAAGGEAVTEKSWKLKMAFAV